MRTSTGEERDPLDRCYTPNVLAQALLGRWIERGLLKPGDTVLDAGAGDGAFVTGCKALKIGVDAVDLDPETCWRYGWTEVDFLSLPAGHAYAAVIGNPPFSHAEAFIDQGLELAPKVCYLLPHLFLGGKQRTVSGVWKRLRFFDPLVERAGFTGPGVKEKVRGKGGQVQHGGFVFDVDHQGDFSGRHLSWGGMRAEKAWLKSQK